MYRDRSFVKCDTMTGQFEQGLKRELKTLESIDGFQISLGGTYLVVWKELEWIKTSFRYAKLESIDSIFDYSYDIEG